MIFRQARRPHSSRDNTRGRYSINSKECHIQALDQLLQWLLVALSKNNPTRHPSMRKTLPDLSGQQHSHWEGSFSTRWHTTCVFKSRLLFLWILGRHFYVFDVNGMCSSNQSLDILGVALICDVLSEEYYFCLYCSQI